MTPDKQREKKYQSLRLYHSGMISLSDLKARFRITTTVLDEEYSSEKDLQDTLGTMSRIEKLERLTMTRNVAKQRAILKYNRRPKIIANREETIAKFATNYRGGLPHNFVRYGKLIAKNKRRAKPRPGSSAGKIGRTRFYGFNKFNKDFDRLERNLLLLMRNRGNPKGMSRALSKARDSIKVSAKLPGDS